LAVLQTDFISSGVANLGLPLSSGSEVINFLNSSRKFSRLPGINKMPSGVFFIVAISPRTSFISAGMQILPLHLF
jgi:hypothetical protein